MTVIVPKNLETKTINRLVNENLNMSNKKFKETKLEDLPIKHRNIEKYLGKENNLDFKYFLIACYFIELNLKTYILSFRNYYLKFTRDYLTNFINNTDNDSKGYIIVGNKKILYCELVNAPDDFLKKLPTNIFDIKIIYENTVNLEKKIDFKEGQFFFGDDIIKINKIKTPNPEYGLFDYISPFSQVERFIKQFEVSFRDNNDNYVIQIINDTLVCKIIKNYSHHKSEISPNTFRNLRIAIDKPFHSFKSIIFKKIHLL